MASSTMETRREIENAVALFVETILAESKLYEGDTNGYAKATGMLESLVGLAIIKSTEEVAQDFLKDVRSRVSDRQNFLIKQINRKHDNA